MRWIFPTRWRVTEADIIDVLVMIVITAIFALSFHIVNFALFFAVEYESVIAVGTLVCTNTRQTFPGKAV